MHASHLLRLLSHALEAGLGIAGIAACGREREKEMSEEEVSVGRKDEKIKKTRDILVGFYGCCQTGN